jgi:DNA-binding NtrC family response regulator
MTAELPILIVDDEDSGREAMNQVLVKEGYAVQTASSAHAGLAAFAGETFAVAFLDLQLPDMDGFAVLRKMKETCPETPVVIITGYGSIESAVQAIKLGAFDYLTKPFTPQELRIMAGKAAANQSLVLENILLRRELRAHDDFDPVIGHGKAMRGVLDLVARAAQTDSTVLITGENGSGKTLVAREIHARSRRRASPFVAVDCGGLPEPAFEEDLFGFIRAGRPSAPDARHGRLELARGGTLFLDEVGRLGLRLQGELLRVFETGRAARLGGKPRRVDARFIAASGIGLAQTVNRGAFREDLYYRLNVVPIHLPPLRERKEDIPLLVDHFLKKHGARAGKDVGAVSTRAMLALTEYDWPGNIRELDSTIERAVVLARGRVVEVDDLMSRGISMGIPALAWSGGQFKSLADMEKEYIKAVFRDQGGNRGRTAAVLGIDRKTLWAKLKKYGLLGRDET